LVRHGPRVDHRDGRRSDGDWDEDVLTLRPGERLAMSYDADVVKAVPAV